MSNVTASAMRFMVRAFPELSQRTPMRGLRPNKSPASARHTRTVEKLSPRELSWLCQTHGFKATIERTTTPDAAEGEKKPQRGRGKDRVATNQA